MSIETTPQCVSPLALADYFEGRLPEFRAAAVEMHLADCSDCVAHARRVRRFLFFWNDGPAVARRTLTEARIAQRLEQAKHEKIFSDVLGALRTWRDRLTTWKERAIEVMEG